MSLKVRCRSYFREDGGCVPPPQDQRLSLPEYFPDLGRVEAACAVQWGLLEAGVSGSSPVRGKHQPGSQDSVGITPPHSQSGCALRLSRPVGLASAAASSVGAELQGGARGISEGGVSSVPKGGLFAFSQAVAAVVSVVTSLISFLILFLCVFCLFLDESI